MLLGAHFSKSILNSIDLWNVKNGHILEVQWLKDITNELRIDKHLQERVVKGVEKEAKQCKVIYNWKAPGNDYVQGYWIKDFSNLREQTAVQTNKI